MKGYAEAISSEPARPGASRGGGAAGLPRRQNPTTKCNYKQEMVLESTSG